MSETSDQERRTGGGLQHIGGLIDLNRFEQARRRAAEREAADPKSARAPAQPNCVVCGGAGWLKLYGTGEYGSESNRYTLVLCDCRQGMMAEKRQRRLDRWSTLEDDHTGDTFDRAVLYEHQRFAYERAHAYAQDMQGFLVLMGDYGVGKSHLAACVAWSAYHAGVGVLWLKSGDLVAHLRDTYRHESETTQSEQLREMGEAPLLCLDDLGAETDARDVQSHINNLIDRRYLKKLPTVIATNKTLDELGGRVASRAAEVGMLALVSGGDKRLHIDEPMEGLTKYHYYARRPILCASCHGRPCLPDCPLSARE